MDRRQFLPTLCLLPEIVKQLVNKTSNIAHKLYNDAYRRYIMDQWVDKAALQLREAIDEDMIQSIIEDAKHEQA